MQNKIAQSEIPSLINHQFSDLPEDLFIPPNALEIFLESFSGPMDVLLYLIKKDNINILELDVSDITDQYLEYIELMDSLKFELAADYLVMAATLAEIKSRLMLPKESFDEEDKDPRANLIERLQEYQRYKVVSEQIAVIPRVDRDFFIASTKLPEIKKIKSEEPMISVDELHNVILDVFSRPNYKSDHLIDFEELSTKERIKLILELLSKKNISRFSKILNKSEGRAGVVVSLLASLELAKDGCIELIQNKSDELYLKFLERP